MLGRIRTGIKGNILAIPGLRRARTAADETWGTLVFGLVEIAGMWAAAARHYIGA